ncbi:MAG: RNA-binding S4 domain-containing protein [Christensenellales bacterium]|jgi:ribosomal 50S subunit-recycling heat shock protein
MRLDKFLKVSRIIKRRSVADSACGVGRVLLNGKEAKSGKQVKAGDEIIVSFGDKKLKARILRVPEGNVSKEGADALYEIIGEDNE